MANNLEIRRLEILSILGDLEHHHSYFKERGIDVGNPDDREAYDIICRIERRIMAQSPKKETVGALEHHHSTAGE